MNSEVKKVYIDMDGVIVDFQTGIDRLPKVVRDRFPEDRDIDEAEGIFSLMEPIPGAIEAVTKLANSSKLDVYILSTAPWLNPSAWSDKVRWVHDHFGVDEDSPLYKRIILSHNKHLNDGDYLIDDRDRNGAAKFKGEHIHFGPESEKDRRDGRFDSWEKVIAYFEELGLLD